MAGIGIYGGTFDPVHQTHLALARLARDRFRLGEVLIVLAPEPPHKRGAFAPFAERAAMLELALASEPDCARIRCSRIEADLPRPSYTIHTVEAIMRRHADAHCYLVIGLDSLAALPEWHRAEELMALVDMIAVNRGAALPAEIQGLVARLRPACRPLRENLWINTAGRALHLVPDFHMPHSSTAIRAALAAGAEPDGLPPAVLAHIRRRHLYSS